MREINFEDPTNLFFVRVAFGSVAALSAMTLYYMYTRIQSKADSQRKITVPPPATPSWGAAAEYAPPPLLTPLRSLPAHLRFVVLFIYLFMCVNVLFVHMLCCACRCVACVCGGACACVRVRVRWCVCQGPNRRRR